MEGNLGKLLVSIGTDTKELATGLTQAQKHIEGFKNIANKVLGLIGFSLTAAALVDLTKKTIEYGEELHKMSERTGIAASEIAKLKYVAEQSDTSLEAVTSTFKFLSRAMNEAKGGNQEAISTFSKFHVEFKNGDGTLRNYKDVMLDVADRIKNTSNQSVVLAESQKLLGRGVQQVLPLFKEGADGIKRMTSEYEQLQKKIGLTDTQVNAFAKNSDALSDSWKTLSTAFQFMLIQVITPLIPKMQEFVHWMIDTDWESVGNFIGDIADGFKMIGDEIFRELKLLEDFNNGMLILGDTLGVGPLARYFGAKDGGASEAEARAAMGQGPPLSNYFGGGAGTEENPINLGGFTVGGGADSGQGISGGSGLFKDKYGTGNGQQAPAGFFQGGGEGALGINFGDITAKMEELKTKWSDISKQMGELWGETMEQITTGFGTSVAEMIVDGADFGESMKKLWQDIAKSVIAEIVKIIAQQIILFTWQAITGTVGSGNMLGGGGGGGKKFFGLFDKGGVIPQAREGLVSGAAGFTTTGNMGESGMHAIVHPNEIISPIDKFFDAINGLRKSEINVYATGAAANDPQLLAELIGTETDRRRRRP